MSNSKTKALQWDRWHVVCLGLLVVYFVFILGHATSVAGGADSAGYLTSARMFSEGRIMIPLRTIPEWPVTLETFWTCLPLGMIARGPELMLRPTYPPGLPLQFAVSASVFGWNWGPMLTNALGAVALVLVTYGCARRLGVRRGTAIAAAAVVGVSPIVIFAAIQPLSDGWAAVWSTLALYAALRASPNAALAAHGNHSRQAMLTSRPRSLAWSTLAGVALAGAVLVRPTDALLVPFVALLLWRWDRLLAAAGGGLPGAVFLGWYQATLYGSPFLTGYGDVGGLFSKAWVIPTLMRYLVSLPPTLPAAVLALCVLPWLPWRSAWRECVAFVGWFVALAAFFTPYLCTHESIWYMRFLLPAFPAVAVVGALGLENFVAKRFRPSAARMLPYALVCLAGISVVTSYRSLQREHMLATAELQEPYRELCLWARDHLPPDAVIATLHASCSLYYYTDFPIIRSDIIGPERFAELRQHVMETGRPVYALLYRHDDEDRRQEQIPGEWREIHRVDAFSLWELQRSQ